MVVANRMANRWKALSPKPLEKSRNASPGKPTSEFTELQKSLESERLQRYRLQAELDRKSSQFTQKEVSYLQLISEYESVLQTGCDLATVPPSEISAMHISRIKSMYGKLMEQIGGFRETAARILANQEADITRRFDSRLRDLQRSQDFERRRHQAALLSTQQAQSSQSHELFLLHQAVATLEARNSELESTNKSLRNDLELTHGEREQLLLRLHQAKKQLLYMQEDTHLQQHSSSLEVLERLPHLEERESGSRTERTGQNSVILLQRTLEKEKKALRTLKTAYAKEIAQRSELELTLRSCLNDLRDVIAKEEKRGRALFLEALLEREKVVGFLRDHLFPLGKSKEIVRKMGLIA